MEGADRGMSGKQTWAAALLGAALFGPAAAAVGAVASGKSAAVSPPAAEFFETRVRPVLAENCYSCHGPAQQMAGLRLDSRAAL